ncbi:hypothetical protein PR048_028037 [Dryococelus australis]|uniref:Uncharacterized protein n=1 Tax=Dryococelus australis TaxID=614101 RepID=A0ABQ9GI45_9NEOP|nr:hypothetical protein PR048_028037 [Dryococelus australis]
MNIPKFLKGQRLLDCSPPTKANRVQSPAGSLRIFASGNRAWTMPLVGGFSRDLSFPPPLYSGATPYSPHLTLISSQELYLKSRPNLSPSHLNVSVCQEILISSFISPDIFYAVLQPFSFLRRKFTAKERITTLRPPKEPSCDRSSSKVAFREQASRLACRATGLDVGLCSLRSRCTLQITHYVTPRAANSFHTPFAVTSNFSEAVIKFSSQHIPPPQANKAYRIRPVGQRSPYVRTRYVTKLKKSGNSERQKSCTAILSMRRIIVSVLPRMILTIVSVLPQDILISSICPYINRAASHGSHCTFSSQQTLAYRHMFVFCIASLGPVPRERANHCVRGERNVLAIVLTVSARPGVQGIFYIGPARLLKPRWAFEREWISARLPTRRTGLHSQRGHPELSHVGIARFRWSTGFLGDLPSIPVLLHINPITLIGSQDLIVKTHPNTSTLRVGPRSSSVVQGRFYVTTARLATVYQSINCINKLVLFSLPRAPTTIFVFVSLGPAVFHNGGRLVNGAEAANDARRRRVEIDARCIARRETDSGPGQQWGQ